MADGKRYLIKDEYLMSEFDYEKNTGIDISEITSGSQRMLWWKCELGHSWQSRVVKRFCGQKCPYCSGKRALQGYNDLSTTNPELISEWDFENNDTPIYEYRRMSNKKVWWRCGKGHRWEAAISKRVQGERCPVCQGKKVLVGFNDLPTTHPSLIEEWDFEKNTEITPYAFSKGSDRKVWWRCKRNHSWSAIISSRASGVACPQCAKELQSSFPEKALYYYLKRTFPDAIAGFRVSGLYSFEIDIFIPSLRVGVEYDGERWHKDIERDLQKNKKCSELNITLIRVREPKCPVLMDGLSLNVLMSSKKAGLHEAIGGIYRKISALTKTEYLEQVDLSRDNADILSLLVSSDKDRSLRALYPDIARQWDRTKNGKLTPENITAGSDKKAWWICPIGHSYLASISSRIQGKGCSVCAGKTVLKGFNDFESRCPELASEWDYHRNLMRPDMVLYGSDKKYWWKCSKGHSYACSINNRRARQNCCYCSGKSVLRGFNDISTTHPDIALQWHTELNEMQPYEVSSGSHKKVWWKCRVCGHQWQSMVYNRCLNNAGCPKCSGRAR